MTLIIRTETEADIEAIRQVGDEAFVTVRGVHRTNPAAKTNLAAMAHILERLVAEEDGRIIGTVRLGLKNEALRVVGLAVLPEFRRRDPFDQKRSWETCLKTAANPKLPTLEEAI